MEDFGLPLWQVVAILVAAPVVIDLASFALGILRRIGNGGARW